MHMPVINTFVHFREPVRGGLSLAVDGQGGATPNALRRCWDLARHPIEKQRGHHPPLHWPLQLAAAHVAGCRPLETRRQIVNNFFRYGAYRDEGNT